MAAVRRAHDARGAIDGAAEIVAVTVLDGPHVNAASNRDRNAFRGGWIDKRALQRNRGFNGVRRIGEHGEHAVAHHLDDRAAAFHDRRAAERVVTHQCRTHPVRLLFPQPGLPSISVKRNVISVGLPVVTRNPRLRLEKRPLAMLAQERPGVKSPCRLRASLVSQSIAAVCKRPGLEVRALFST